MAPVDLLIDDNDSLQSLSPPLSQRPYPSSPSPNEQAPASPLSLPVFLEASAATFYTLRSLPDIIPDMPATFPSLPNVVQKCMSRMAPHCTVCYFLRRKRPIKIILTHPRGGYWEEYDDHATEFARCPWRLLTDCPSFHRFSSEVSTSLRLSDSGGAGWFVCSVCTEPWDTPTYHQRCMYGPDAVALAYLIWEDLSTRDSVFSLLHKNLFAFPDFQDRSAYAVWLGSSVSQTRPTLNNIHLLIVAYHFLRWTSQLPR